MTTKPGSTRPAAPGSDHLDELDTRGRLLDADEELFAERGIAATSLRQVTGHAGANVAAVNYHFGSKDGLVVAVFERILGPLNAERLERLDAAVAAAAGRAPAPEAVLEAFVGPALRLGTGTRPTRLLGLMGRAHSEASHEIRKAVFAQFEEVIARFAHAIHRAAPELTLTEVYWRLEFSIGAMAFILADPPAFRALTSGDREEEEERNVARLVAFLAAGFRARSAEAKS